MKIFKGERKMKKLTKSSSNIVLTGTLAGIAEYIGFDPTILRIIYLVLLFLGVGSPVFLYIVLAILIPAAPKNKSQYYSTQEPRKRKEAEKIDDDDWSDF
ncbi:MAG: PspC domain-containing protein [Streptococcaceae bacterium]|jgi:phage shock protein PspC (stress-responsive transcriptional regulator)|nr:PspC domain-containing protein [Streptococcaceae bacterium]